MCACDGTYVCPRHKDTRDEPGHADWLNVQDRTDYLNQLAGVGSDWYAGTVGDDA